MDLPALWDLQKYSISISLYKHMLKDGEIDTLFKALAEPHRRQLLRLLATRELSSGEIAAHFDITGPAVSQHLTVLAVAGLVSMQRKGTKHLYRSSPQRMELLRGYLADFWMASLETLKVEAEAEQRRKTMQSLTDVVEVQIQIAASPETVYSFFTDPSKMVK